MKKGLALILVMVFTCSCLIAQSNNDSLLTVYQSAATDSSRIDALHQFIKTNYSTPDSAIKYAEFAVEFSRNIDNKYWLAKSYNLLAIAYYYQGDLINSKKNLNESLKYYSFLKDQSGMATCYNGIGVVNYDQGKLYDALEYFIKSIRIKQKTDDTTSIAMTLNNIGNVYKDLGKYDRSMEYYNKSMELKEKVNDRHGLAMTLNNIGLLNHDHGDYETALDYYNRSLKIKKEIADLHGEAMTLNNIGLTYEVQKKYKDALSYYQKSIDLREKINDQFGLAMNLVNIATVYRETGDFTRAYKYLFRAEKIAKEVGATTQLRDCYQRLYETYERQGSIQSAYKYYKLFEETKDSIMNEESLKNVQKLQAKYENEKQQLEIQNLSKKDELNKAQLEKNKAELTSKRIVNIGLIVGIGVCIGLIIFFFVILKYRRRKETELEQSLEEKEVLFREVHHRVKNNFQLISSLLNLHLNNTDNEAVQMALNEARDRINSMSLVHEKLYKSKSLSNINLKDYVSDLVVYLLDNFDEDVDQKIEIDELELDIETAIPLGLIFNELITNSMKYAFKKREGGKITIAIKKDGAGYEVHYADDGIGLPDHIDFDNLDSLGLNLVQILVLQLHGQLNVIRENGTAYSFSIRKTT
ncbi:MAG: tetratricopeptide repeat protein [Flavobacteriales bacterium]|nr:tetratricopeptide repeat protein [Flavobacteriales bacterium]